MATSIVTEQPIKLWTLTEGAEIQIRTPPLALRNLVRAGFPKDWSGKLTLRISRQVNQFVMSTGKYKYKTTRRMFSFNFYTNQHVEYERHDVWSSRGRDVVVEVEPGEIVICSRGRECLSDSPFEFHLRAFTDNEIDQEQLTIARDAIFDGDVERAKKIAREIIPYGIDVFVEFVRREQAFQTKTLAD